MISSAVLCQTRAWVVVPVLDPGPHLSTQRWCTKIVLDVNCTLSRRLSGMASSLEIHCSLPPSDVGPRRAAWEAMAQFAVSRERIEEGFRIEFAGGEAVGRELAQLAVAEEDCCGWASWQVRPAVDRYVLEVTGPPERMELLAKAAWDITARIESPLAK